MRKMLIILAAAIVFVLLCAAALNLAVIAGSSGAIVSESDPRLRGADCIIVLGARVYASGRLSPILQDRVDTALSLYDAGVAPKLLLSGDHGTKGYDEVNAMLEYTVESGVAPNVVFLDHAGFSTYDSIYRAKHIFQCKKIVIVTQRFHLYRALYIAQSLGIEAYGVTADKRVYANQTYNELRESLARIKDFALANIIKPASKYLGEPIPISGDASATHDKKYY